MPAHPQGGGDAGQALRQRLGGGRPLALVVVVPSVEVVDRDVGILEGPHVEAEPFEPEGVLDVVPEDAADREGGDEAGDDGVHGAGARAGTAAARTTAR